MIVVGLTGNLGMGKSTAARFFREMGAAVIDADAIVGELLDDRAVIGLISDFLGEQVVQDGRLDRRRIADMVFADAHLRIGLEDILHPRVFERVDGLLRELPPDTGIAVVEVPVLFERGYQGRFDRVVTVYAPDEVADRRLRDKGFSDEEIKRRRKCQLPIDIKVRGADRVIDNGGSPEKTKEQVAAIYEELLRADKRQGNN